MENSNPANPSMKLDETMSSKTHEEIQSIKDVPFMEAVGSLLYVAQVTRPVIAYTVNMVSQFCKKPSQKPWEVVKRIMRYLCGTAGARLEYSKHENAQLTGFIDQRRASLGTQQKALSMGIGEETRIHGSRPTVIFSRK